MASYTCTCGSSEVLNVWNSQLFSSVPLLTIPQQVRPVTLGSLVTTLLETPINLSCSQCNEPLNGSLRAVRGKYSIYAINRRTGGQSLIRTSLSDQDSQTEGEQLLGELVSVVSHKGGAGGGHWISYHYVGGSWYINNDDNLIIRSPYHPYDSPNLAETVNLCIFSCN